MIILFIYWVRWGDGSINVHNNLRIPDSRLELFPQQLLFVAIANEHCSPLPYSLFIEIKFYNRSIFYNLFFPWWVSFVQLIIILWVTLIESIKPNINNHRHDSLNHQLLFHIFLFSLLELRLNRLFFLLFQPFFSGANIKLQWKRTHSQGWVKCDEKSPENCRHSEKK